MTNKHRQTPAPVDIRDINKIEIDISNILIPSDIKVSTVGVDLSGRRILLGHSNVSKEVIEMATNNRAGVYFEPNNFREGFIRTKDKLTIAQDKDLYDTVTSLREYYITQAANVPVFLKAFENRTHTLYEMSNKYVYVIEKIDSLPSEEKTKENLLKIVNEANLSLRTSMSIKLSFEQGYLSYYDSLEMTHLDVVTKIEYRKIMAHLLHRLAFSIDKIFPDAVRPVTVAVHQFVTKAAYMDDWEPASHPDIHESPFEVLLDEFIFNQGV